MKGFIQYKKIDRHPMGLGYIVVIVAAPGVTVKLMNCDTAEEARVWADKNIVLPWERNIPGLEQLLSEIKL